MSILIRKKNEARINRFEENDEHIRKNKWFSMTAGFNDGTMRYDGMVEAHEEKFHTKICTCHLCGSEWTDEDIRESKGKVKPGWIEVEIREARNKLFKVESFVKEVFKEGQERKNYAPKTKDMMVVENVVEWKMICHECRIERTMKYESFKKEDETAKRIAQLQVEEIVQEATEWRNNREANNFSVNED